MNDHTMLTTRAAAEYLGVKERALAQNWFRWHLTAYKVGRRNMFRVSDLERYLKDHKIAEPRRRAAA
jgi:excisionase family DNA binding protein